MPAQKSNLRPDLMDSDWLKEMPVTSNDAAPAHIFPEETSVSSNFDQAEITLLKELEKKILWLSSWTIHNANHLRESCDGLKVGGHQASCASIAAIMTALYMKVLRPQDRIAVKPHASPIFHAIQYLLGNQTQEKMENFRAMGGMQSYPSRTKDGDMVGFLHRLSGLRSCSYQFCRPHPGLSAHERNDPDRSGTRPHGGPGRGRGTG